MSARDCVLTHPHHPSLCGVVKFSEQLAARLGIPCHRRLDMPCLHPLVSVKGAEGDMSLPLILPWQTFDLFAHDAYGCVVELAKTARRVYAANGEIANKLLDIRPDVIRAWCPSTIQGDDSRRAFNVLTFGMAHKLQIAEYERLKADLDAEWGDDYTVSVSTAIHEGSPWDATAEVADKLRAIFGNKLRVLGYLADDALVRELASCDAVALYFAGGARENNTTLHAAMASGKRVYTNYDALSPRSWHGYTWERLIQVVHAA
jgi:hypothetical protein